MRRRTWANGSTISCSRTTNSYSRSYSYRRWIQTNNNYNKQNNLSKMHYTAYSSRRIYNRSRWGMRLCSMTMRRRDRGSLLLNIWLWRRRCGSWRWWISCWGICGWMILCSVCRSLCLRQWAGCGWGKWGLVMEEGVVNKYNNNNH